MRRFLLGFCVVFSPAFAAQAEEIMFSYGTELTLQDAVSSRGTPLEGWCTLLQQDRANWHRFNRRDTYDEPDPYFHSAERRAMMAGKCEVNGNVFADPGAQIRSGNRTFDLTVQVYGSGGQVTRIIFADRF